MSTGQDDSPQQPTATGLEKYEGGFYEGGPCTCSPRCAPACKGECGCKACSMAFNDFGYDE